MLTLVRKGLAPCGSMCQISTTTLLYEADQHQHAWGLERHRAGKWFAQTRRPVPSRFEGKP